MLDNKCLEDMIKDRIDSSENDLRRVNAAKGSSTKEYIVGQRDAYTDMLYLVKHVDSDKVNKIIRFIKDGINDVLGMLKDECMEHYVYVEEIHNARLMRLYIYIDVLKLLGVDTSYVFKELLSIKMR